MKKTNKDIKKSKLLTYLGNPENEFLARVDWSIKILGYKQDNAIYKAFTPAECSEIEIEALAMRRANSAPKSVKIDKALYDAASGGDVAAMKLYYERIEGWKPGQAIEHSGEIKYGSLDDFYGGDK